MAVDQEEGARVKRIFSRAGDTLRPIGHVDGLTDGRVVGWALGRGDLTVEAWVNHECVARSATGRQREDVAAAYPGRAGAVSSGFSLDLPPGSVESDSISTLRIVARPSFPFMPAATLARFQIAGAGFQDALVGAPASHMLSPFPREITDMVAGRWPDDCSDLVSPQGQQRFAWRLKQLFETPGVNSTPALAAYVRYLNVTLAHCRFVEKHFPATNKNAAQGAADFHCKPNSVRELFPIIHQLYVLRSYGVTGDFAEFGCFKGYSSAMLSFACQQIGVTMHIFDSFAGLPPAEGSGYKAGQYAGGVEEVRDNVTCFGSIGAVEFHKGFFADTFREWRPPELMCIWMDVDLEVSARDLMVVADRLDPRGTVFSHECSAGIFRGGEIVSPASPDNPVAPMLARFQELGRPLTGRYVSGYTGAFWAHQEGVPVLNTEVLFSLNSPGN